MIKKIPDAIVIVFSILVIMTILTWVIPAGSFDRIEKFDRKDIVVPGTYHSVEQTPQNGWDLLRAPFRGFMDAGKIIAFVLLVGGAFALVMATGAIDAGLMRLIRLTRNKRESKFLMLSLLMILFSLCGFTFGMSEESLVFVLFTIPMARTMGFDVITGVAIPFVTSGIGGAAAAYNPFSVGVALEISGLPFPTGEVERLVIWSILTAITIGFVLWYARRVEKDPTKSLLYGLPEPQGLKEVKDLPFTTTRLMVILIFLATLVIIPIGASSWDWDIIEVGAAFLGMGIISSLLMRTSANTLVKHFTDGASGMLTAAIVICISRSVLVVCRDGQIIDTILYHLSNSIAGLPKEISIQVMFIVQGIINFFIPSGSGQAAITMPVMAPLADLIGLSRESAVLAFQLAAGFFDLIIPTSGVTMGVLALAGIPFNIWLKWMWKLMLACVLVAMVALAVTV